jgi:uncharacterized membrane protein
MKQVRNEMAAAGIISVDYVNECKRHWKWGVFYVNPDDKSIFVSKHFGAGFTLNFAHRGSWVILFFLLLPALSVLAFVFTR